MKHFFDMDGTLAVYDWWVYKPDGDAPWYEKIRGTHYYRHCKSHPKMVDFVNGLLWDCPEDVYILTSAGVPEEDYYEHVADKIIWIQKHVKGLLPEHFLVANSRRPEIGKQTKSMVAKRILGRPLTETDRLYDDFNPNLEEWRDAGGHPVKILNGINHFRPDVEVKCIL